MGAAVELQVRLWPWSIEDEVVNIQNGLLDFAYFGSPIFVVSDDVELILPVRQERFAPLGPAFNSMSGKRYRLYQAPHGFLFSRPGQSLLSRCGGYHQEISLHTNGAISSLDSVDPEEKPMESELAKTILAWHNSFNDLLDIVSSTISRHETRLPWSKIGDYLKNLENDQAQPRMSLIVHLADKMRPCIGSIVHTARKILLRERKMMPAGRVAEMDNACLRWYIRQPGSNMAEKASSHRQSLLGVSRKESFNTLENMVLKDFLRRCRDESRRYLAREAVSPHHQTSTRAGLIRQYQANCSELSRHPNMIEVRALKSRVKPNYALQNDARYRLVWRNYQRILRQEDERDCSWDWQSRTWADIVRLLINTALCAMDMDNKAKAVRESSLGINKEQKLGHRLRVGTEPGPFVFSSTQNPGQPEWILEVVHEELAEKHPATQELGRLGGHLYLVLEKISTSTRIVQVIWAAHTASSNHAVDWDHVSYSAQQALKYHERVISEHRSDFPKLSGLVVASVQGRAEAELQGSHLPILLLPTEPDCWSRERGNIKAIIETILEDVQLQEANQCAR